jgi:hypothetical protein
MGKAPLELFCWNRPVDGFIWDNCTPLPSKADTEKPREGRYLVERSPENNMCEYYHPLRLHPTLYQTFATLQPTEEDFLRFANEYGSLGSGRVLVRQKSPFRPVEAFDYWRQAHWKLRRVIEEIVAIRDRDAATLRQWFGLDDERAWYERQHEGSPVPDLGLIAMRKQAVKAWLLDWAIAADSEDESILRIARGWAQTVVNDAMSGSGRNPDAMTSAHVVLNKDTQQMSLHIVPTNLLAAMWLQCAWVLTSEGTFKTCENCGKRFEVAPGKRRRQSLYCSTACKVAAYRARKGHSNIFAWMSPYYAQVRTCPDWDSMSTDERAAALKEIVITETDGRKARTMASMDHAERWPRALAELEESWEASQPVD